MVSTSVTEVITRSNENMQWIRLYVTSLVSLVGSFFHLQRRKTPNVLQEGFPRKRYDGQVSNLRERERERERRVVMSV